jgi:Domain of unknown function (DUF4412)
MKRIHILLGLALTVVVAHADLIIETSVVNPQSSNYFILKMKGGKVRAEEVGGDRITIYDLNTVDELTLFHKTREAVKTPLLKFRQTARFTNAIAVNAKLPKPQYTGKTEKVNGYDTEIYTWTNSRGESVTLWVARNFPNLAKIKKDLDKLEKLHTSLDKEAPGSSELPGMVLKAQRTGIGPKGGGLTSTTTVVSAREETIDASIFELPKDYHEVTSP